MKKKISLRVIRRISFYYEALLKLNLPDDHYISSTQLEDITGVSCNQVRQDFFYLGISIGKQKKGYQVKKLFKELKKILSIDTGADVIVIGAGRLGRALSEYKLFKVRNVNVKALFDVKEELVGNFVHVFGEEVPIMHIDDLDEYLKQHSQIRIALLTVPEHSAQALLDKLVNLGIKGIVNFTPRILKRPEGAMGVQIVNDCIGASLYKIVYQIYHQGIDKAK
ncbi:MAG: redox-sensing transcriptional repressor Rex [Candidatus Aminicenantes bacterium]|nr:redox-sensing transcriptional repressor Rex [Candidatus Aminicenantes bacterium]NIM83505.1 redox-sensing transcriptional repressor Rex [Candidatus Aminicenantes bacterium]NIN22894.1 redox-sensing transcriptional repressor Rex [Candidatus Aminicenantes bacterium]NIN46633.1 redox-sensing transcriptional repressor Rex [Candidatus Aminicenantes bacterium]NIN89536.1 redox-sensing transcriptional repressor Rex [Candidatus Aminicenantes bacterium]